MNNTSEKQLSAMDTLSVLNAIPGFHLILLPDAPHFTIVGATDDYLAATYLSRAEVIGRGVFETLPDNPGNTGASGIKNLSHSLELVVRHKTEQRMADQRYDIRDPRKAAFEYRVWRPRNKPVLDEMGDVQFIVHSVEDITENARLTEEKGVSAHKLSESEAFSRQVLESSPDCVKVLDKEGRLQFMNFNGRCVMEIDDFASVDNRSWADLWGPDNREKVISAIDTALRGDTAHFQAFCPTAKGTPKWWDVMVTPIPDSKSGSVSSILSISRDITGQRSAQQTIEDSEARFRSIVEQAPVALALTLGEEMVFESINEAMLQIIHRKTKDEVIGKTVREALPEVVCQPLYEILQRVIQTGETFRGTEMLVDLATDGVLQSRYFNLTYSCILDPAGVRSVLHMAVDVTAQVLSRRKLEASQRSLFTLFEESPVGIATLSASDDLVFETANEFYSQLVGRSPADLIDRPLLEALPEIKGQGFDKLLKKVIATGIAYSANEVPVDLMKQGQLEAIYVNLTYQPRKEGSVITGILVVATDVTEQVRSRKKVEQSEQFARNIFYNSPVAHLVYVGKDIVLQEANEKMLEVLGRSKEIIGLPILEAIPEFRQTDLAKHYAGVLATGRAHEEQAKQVPIIRNGQTYTGYYDFTFKPLTDEGGSVYGTICSAVDVTEQVTARQKVEEKESALEAALEQVRLSKEAAELGTFDMDLKTGELHWDERCRTLFGISHNNAVSFDEDFVKRLHPDDQQRVVAVVDRTFQKVLSNGDYDVEYRTIGAEDGVERWVRAKGKVYFDLQDAPVRFIGSVLDITEQKNALQKIETIVEERTLELAAANESLQSINRELQRSNANLEEFAHAASHDLKEPVRKITFFSNQLKDQLADRLDDKEKFSFGRIEHATQRMGNLIDDLLVYSHVSQRPHETEPIDLNLKVQGVLEDLELDIQEKKAVIHVGKLPVVQGYRRQLQQLFQNLLSNALKYSKADVPPVIDISAGQIEENNQLYDVISVQDNGIGFEEQYADKIFQMFARLHGRKEYSGTGVGLSIAKKVVENHYGVIKVKSVPGEGSIFHIHLPVAAR